MQDNSKPNLYPSLPNNCNDLNKAERGNRLSMSNGNGKSNFQENSDIISAETKDYKYFWKRVLADLTNKNLIPVKILFFFKYATLFVLYPFLTLHMDALGLNEWEIGVNQATAPIVAILGPPVAGLLADKIGNFKVILTLITLANAAISLLLLLVPVARETIIFPANITFEIKCDPTSHQFILDSIDPYECSLNSSRWSTIPKENVIQCGEICRSKPRNTTDDNLLELFPEFPLSIKNFSVALNNQSYTFRSTVENRPKFLCDNNGTSERCQLTTSYDVEVGNGDTETTTMLPHDFIQVDYSTLSFSKLRLINPDGSERSFNNATSNVTQPRFSVQGPIIFDDDLHDSLTCTQPSNTMTSSSADEDDHDCETKCFLQLDRKLVCGNDSVNKVYNVWLSFGVYTAFRLLLGFASATSFIMFEGAVLAILKQYGGDYGLQRVSATFAAIISAPLSGLLLQYYSFKPVFYLYATLQTFSAIITMKIDLKFKKPSEDILGHLKEVLSQVEILIFFAAMLCSGTAWGYLETFLFLFLKKLGAGSYLMGLTISVGGLFGLPFLIFSRPIIKRLGHVNVLCIGLLFYGIRYMGYSIIEDPWLCLPFEAMESITSSLAITAAATYAVALSTLQTIASVQGMMGALYFGIGRGAGSFLGGLLIREFGHRETFQIFGVGSFIAFLLYSLVNLLYLRRHSKASSGIDINNMNGLVLSNGSAKLKPDHNSKEQFPMGPSNLDSELGYGKVNPGFDDGDIINPDDNKFTDIPLDEDNQSGQVNNNNKLQR